MPPGVGGSGYALMFVCRVSYRILSLGGGSGTSKFDVDMEGVYST